MMLRALVTLLFLAILAVAQMAAGPALAQQQDVRDLVDRIDRLERDLNILQSQFYRSQSGSPTVITSPAAGGAAGSSGGALSTDVYNTLDQRIAAIEDQIRTLTGAVEKANHDSSELGSRLDRMQADNDVRFKELEQKGGAAAAATGTPPQPAQPAATSTPAAGAAASDQPAAGSEPAPGPSDTSPASGSAPHPLGQIRESDLKRLEPKNADTAAATSPAPAVSPKTPQEQYDAAFAQLRNNDNDGASKSFQAFLAQHPKDPLAGNATFWLGQIAYSQGKFEQAAPIFFDAYSKYPKSAKAGESLLKVGLSMSSLGKKKEACAALARFTSEFPDAGDGLKRQSTTEKQKLGCGG